MLSLVTALENIATRVNTLVEDELEAQGHNATGKLSKSLRNEVSKTAINGYAEDYSVFVNNRSRPHGFNKVGVDNLREWLKVKGIPEAALWPIIKTIEKEGTPTRGSYKHSKNGRRTDFVSVVINDNKKVITEEVNEQLLSVLGQSINDILGKQKILK